MVALIIAWQQIKHNRQAMLWQLPREFVEIAKVIFNIKPNVLNHPKSSKIVCYRGARKESEATKN